MSPLRHAAAQRRLIWPPEPGHFLLRLAKGAWRVPCQIHRDADGRWHAEVDGEHHPAHADPAHAYMIDALWCGGIKIQKADFDWYVAMKEHARLHDPSHPSLHARTPMDPRRLRPLVFGKVE